MIELAFPMNVNMLREAGIKGGKSIKHRWTDEERSIVIRDYDGTKLNTQRIALSLGVTFNAVKGQAAKLGLLQNKSPRWSEEELELLAELVHKYVIPQVAKRMHRSANAVKIKATRLKMQLRTRNDWYTKREVSEICGVDHKKVQRWIDNGQLTASYHNGRKPQKFGMNMWHIEAKDLRTFLIDNAGELLGRNVDLQQIVWILT